MVDNQPKEPGSTRHRNLISQPVMRLINVGILKKKFRKAAGGVKKMENVMRWKRLSGAHIPLHTLTAPRCERNCSVGKNHCSTSCLCAFSGEIAQMSANIRAQYEASRAERMPRLYVNWLTCLELMIGRCSVPMH